MLFNFMFLEGNYETMCERTLSPLNFFQPKVNTVFKTIEQDPTTWNRDPAAICV